MKIKFIAIFTTIILLVILFIHIPVNKVIALDVSDEEKYEYTIDPETNTVTITGDKGYTIEEDGMNVYYSYIRGNVTIPTELEGFPVTEIGNNAFNGCQIDSLFIPEGIEKINNCWGSPIELHIPASAKYIAVGSFNATRLEKIVVSENNPVYYTSQGCLIEKTLKALVQLTKDTIIPDDGSVEVIPSGDLFNGMRIQELIIPDSVTDIEPHALFGCTIADLYIGKRITEITGSTFYNCSVENSITVSNENPLYHSQDNCLIDTENKILILGCNNSKIPTDSSVEAIGYHAFSECYEICNIIIPDAIKIIDSYAFSGCENLQSIFISKNVECIGTGVFDGCSQLSEIKVDYENLIYHSIDNCLIETAKKTLIQGCYNSIIPDDGSVEAIGECAFYGLSNIYYLNIPEGIKTIGDSAFCSTSLIMVSLPSTIEKIYPQNFNTYDRLKYILYGDSAEKRESIKIYESWSGQNSDLYSAQWYYNGEKPFENITLSATAIECMKYVDGYMCASCIGWRLNPDVEWFKYNFKPQITVTYEDGTTFIGTEEEIENKIGFPIEIYDNQSDVFQWDIGNYTARICCMDQTVPLDITIVDHPIEKIKIQDVTMIENTDEYYHPYPKYTVTYKDGTVETLETRHDDFIILKGKYIHLENNSFFLQESNLWVAGQSYEVVGSLLNLTDTFTVTIKEKSLTNIAITARPKKLKYTIGEDIDLTGMIVTAYYDNDTIERITDYTVSGYDSTKLGKQNVTVTYKNVDSAFEVNVLPINVTSVELDKQKIACFTDDIFGLNAIVYPQNATDKSIVWSSYNNEVASVDENGNVKAKKAGQTIITATTKDGNFCTSCSVYVICSHKELIYKKSKKPTCTNNGNSSYYICSICNILFNEDKFTKLYEKDTLIEPTGHCYDNLCDISCNTCKEVRTITHNYKDIITKATLSKNGKKVKKCSVCGKIYSTATIYYPKTIKFSMDSYTYNGKVKTPSVVVKDYKGNTLKKNTDYTVSYATGRKNVGKYKVTIKFKGNYSGTKTLYFKINPVKTTVKSLTAGKKSLKVAITKKTAQVTGYQIQYATNKSFKSAKSKYVTSYKATSATLKGLTAKKTYYVRVRTYKTVNGVKYYSGWSTVKYKKTK